MAGTLRALGLQAAGANYENISRALRRLSIDTSHWTGKGHLRGKINTWARCTPLSEILRPGRAHNSANLKRRLINENIFAATCVVCGLADWMGTSIPLELDHIDGVRDNNSIENLRLICPNCHAHTPTYRGRNIKRRRK
jgi:5-methylcytosine-specific restriction endonuclease McrA